jgi:hypothetical protein
MSDPAQDMLKRIQSKKKEGDKKPKAAVNADDFYSHLIISKQKRRGLAIALTIFFFILLSLLFNNSIIGASWLVILSPILLVALLICVLPPTEDWVYKPWQAKAQQYERFISGR